MGKLPDSVCKLRDIANIQSDELYDAWEKLCSIQEPTLQDLEQWLETKQRFEAAQENFEKHLYQFLTSGLNA